MAVLSPARCDLLDDNAKGKKLLAKVKTIKCSPTTTAKPSTIKGTLMSYFAKVAPLGNRRASMSGDLGGEVFNQLRKSLKLGGDPAPGTPDSPRDRR